MKSTIQKRTILEYEGDKKGPLLVVLGAIHGNEMAGVKALELVGKMLEVEQITNPNFTFRGKMVGLVGNKKAVHANVRFVDEDLNRIWKTEKIQKIQSKPPETLNTEEKELLELLSIILCHIEQSRPSELYILDLHTTSSRGGIFTIPSNDPKSLFIAQNLHAPVILNMLEGITGTTLHYFNNRTFPEIPTTAVTFEAGQHNDHTSINRCIAAIINFLRSINCVNPNDVENIHDEVLKLYSKQLPPISRLLYKHEVRAGDMFKMKEGFQNFDVVKKGDVLAQDYSGPIFAKRDGLLLMPLYQLQGEEGFFLVRSKKTQTVTRKTVDRTTKI